MTRVRIACLTMWLPVFFAGACTPKLPQAPPARKINVETWVVERSSLREEIDLPGIVRADSTVQVAAEVAAKIEAVNVDTGANVEKGQALLVFDDADLASTADQAAAQVRSLEARLAEIKLGARDEQIAEAKAGLEAATSQWALAKTVAERRRALFEKEVLPQEALDQALTQLEQAEAQKRRAEEAVSLLEAGARDEAIQALEAQRDAAAAAADMAKRRLEKAVVKSPLTGVVIRRYMDPDELAAPGVPLFDIIPETPVRVSLGVPERVFAKMKKHDPVTVGFQVLGVEVPAKISRLAPAANPRTLTFSVDVDLENPIVVDAPNPGGKRRIPIRPGLIADVTFTLSVHEDAVVVPGDAVVLEGDIFLVYVVEDGLAAPRPVELGVKQNGRMEILSGLEAGDRLIVEGQRQVRGGDEVTVVKEHKTSVDRVIARDLAPPGPGGDDR